MLYVLIYVCVLVNSGSKPVKISSRLLFSLLAVKAGSCVLKCHVECWNVRRFVNSVLVLVY